MRPLRTFTIEPSLPAELAPLLELAHNLWWCWNGDALDLFRRLDPESWETSYHNPVAMLGRMDQHRLMQVAADPKHSVQTRKQAIFSAGQAGVSTADLIALYPRLNERELKEQLIWVLSEKRDPAAGTRLMEIAKSDPDRELRRKAIFWLGQSNDPRVKDFLLEIINGPR
jgi:glucan phosphorylase